MAAQPGQLYLGGRWQIDAQQIRFEMAFAASRVTSLERMIAQLRGKGLACGKPINGVH